MSGAAQEPSAHLPTQPARAPQIPGARGAQAATEANRAAVRAAFEARQAGTRTITSLFAADMRGGLRVVRPCPRSTGIASSSSMRSLRRSEPGSPLASGSVPCGSARSTRMATP